MKLRSISTKITLLFVGALLLNGALVIFITLYQTSSMYTNEYDQEIQEIVSKFQIEHAFIIQQHGTTEQRKPYLEKMIRDFNKSSSYQVRFLYQGNKEVDSDFMSAENVKKLRLNPYFTTTLNEDGTNYIAALIPLMFPLSGMEQSVSVDPSIDIDEIAADLSKAPSDDLIIMKKIPFLNERSTPLLKNTAAAVLILSLPLLLILVFVLRRLTKPITEMSAISEHFADGDFERQVVVKSNDEIGQLAMSLNQMAARLKAKEEARDAFLAGVSHELRTPLTTLKANSRGIAVGVVQQDEVRSYVESNIEEIDRLIQMVNDLILVATLEQTLELHVERINLNVLVDSVVHSMRLLAQKNNVAFQVLAEREFEVTADKSKIKQVLINVLHNAIQHSPKNSTVTVELKQTSSVVNITIRDEGRGFSEEQLEHLFERFYRDQQSTGLGLGLYISQRIVQAHQGMLSAYNHTAGGACVEMMLPEK